MWYESFDDIQLIELGVDFISSPDDMNQVIAESDFLSLHLHLNDKTRHIIGKRDIGKIKDITCIINVTCGVLVDEEAMYKAFLDGKIGGAGVTDGTSRKRAGIAAENADRIARGEEHLYRVD